MELSALETFQAIARLGSLAAAARACGKDPSAVSRIIAALEAELGVRLVQRSTRRLALTEAGAAYLARIEPLIDELAAAQDAVSGLVELPRGRLRVTASAAFGQVVLGPMIAPFRRAYPDIELDLLLTDEIVDLVGQRIDVALRLGPRPTGEVVAARLTATRKRLVASPDYLARRAPILDPADIAGHDCLVFPLDGYRSLWMFRTTDGRRRNVSISGRFSTTNAIVLRDTAIAGLGLSLLADWLAEPDLAAGRLVEVLPEWEVAARAFDTGVWVVYPSRAFLPSKARVFIDHVRAGLGQRTELQTSVRLG